MYFDRLKNWAEQYGHTLTISESIFGYIYTVRGYDLYIYPAAYRNPKECLYVMADFAHMVIRFQEDDEVIWC